MKIALTWLHGFIRSFVHHQLLAYSKIYIILYPFWQKLQWKPIHIVMRHHLICPANLFRLSSICHNSISPPFTSSHNEKKIYIQCNANICSIMQMGSCKPLMQRVAFLSQFGDSCPITAADKSVRITGRFPANESFFPMSRGDILLYTWHGNA